ncbi:MULTISPECIES: VOC family protein [unclassified Mycobacterium]|uniref:VOC family protein n=1 Tax=unclassified Mycobacterium TaxID=2642494 RepID=UPI0029C77F1A|nr:MULTISPECIES: VOC family protein [unclassified Mycobacterium]
MTDTQARTISAQTTRVASSVIRVRDVDRSVNFYSDVFACRVALREPDAALLLTPDGFQLYLYSKSSPGPFGVSAVQYLMWATDSEAELQRITRRLRAYDTAAYTHTENALTLVEACEPDHGRIIVAYPGPELLPRDLIASRFRGR